MENTKEPGTLSDPTALPGASSLAPGMKDFGKHALWIYGVIVGLAIRESLSATYNHDRASSPRYEEFVEIIRFLVFISVISRFYLGAAFFFETVHGERSDPEKYPPKFKRFGVDFLMGLIHFMLFFGWAGYLVSHTVFRFGLTPAFLMMLGILLYDGVWLIISSNYCTRNDIGKWTAINALSAVISLGFFGAVGMGYSWMVSDFATNEGARRIAANSAEFAAMFPILAFGFYDFGVLIRGERALPGYLRKFVKIFEWDHRYPGGPIDPNAA